MIIAPMKQHADKPHLLFHSAQSTVNLVRCHQAKSKAGRSLARNGLYQHSDPLTRGGANTLILRSIHSGWCQCFRTQIHSLRMVSKLSHTQIHSLEVVSMFLYTQNHTALIFKYIQKTNIFNKFFSKHLKGIAFPFKIHQKSHPLPHA
jgi:hypothetical protein